MLKAIIWDFDGTLCDTYPAIAGAVNAALANFGASASLERVIELSSVSMDGCIQTLARECGTSYEQLNHAFRQTYQHVDPAQQPPFAGVHEVLQQLAEAGVNHFIVTHRRRTSLLTLLTLHQLLPYFTEIIAADDGYPRKPAPDAILYLLERYAISARDALMIGDRDLDILAGQAAGVATYLFRGSFASVKPTRTIVEFHELADLFKDS